MPGNSKGSGGGGGGGENLKSLSLKKKETPGGNLQGVGWEGNLPQEGNWTFSGTIQS